MPEVYQLGPATYEVNAAVTAGQVVMVDGSTGKIKPATALGATVLGVARDDAAPAGSGSSSNFATLRPEVAVYSAPYEVKVTAYADILFGEKVVVGTTAGTVAPIAAVTATASANAATATDISSTRSIVGYCTEPGGIVAGAKGRIKLV